MSGDETTKFYNRQPSGEGGIHERVGVIETEVRECRRDVRDLSKKVDSHQTEDTRIRLETALAQQETANLLKALADRFDDHLKEHDKRATTKRTWQQTLVTTYGPHILQAVVVIGGLLYVVTRS